jgi:hypothetical protein
MGYTPPCTAGISSSWQDHKNRNPPSGEPGTDYACGYGTTIIAAGDGYISDLTTSNAGGTGRYITIDLDDGRRVRYLHLSAVWAGIGQRVGRGEGIAASGASGFGSDYGYGSHTHVTLFPNHSYDFGHTLDFQLYVGEDDMPLTQADKQIIKDSMLEFYSQVGPPPAGHEGWQFFQHAVWNAPVIAQDVDGQPLRDEAGNPVKFAAHGYLANTNAIVVDTHNDTDEGRTRNRTHPLTTPAWVGGVLLGLIGLVEVIRLVIDYVA